MEAEEELRRETEMLEMHKKDGATAQRSWGWDLHEMREAAMMDDSMLDDTADDPCPAPTVSGFTPTNRYSDMAPSHLNHEDAAVKSKSVDKPRASKRPKTQSSASTTASKSKKAASSKKTKRAKAAAQLDYQDISQGLSRTKPTSSRDGVLPVKDGLSLGGLPLEQDPGLERFCKTSVELGVKPAFKNDRRKQSNPSGLAARYEATHANCSGSVVHQATPPTPPKSDEVQAELTTNDQSHGQVSPTQRKASLNSNVQLYSQKNLESHGSIVVRDFGAPPFTQTSPPTLQGRNSPRAMILDDFDLLDSISDDLSGVEDFRRGDHGEDEILMGDECLEETMQSMAVPAEEESLGSDWRPQDFSDDTLHIDEQLGNDQSHWPGAIPDSDGVVIYDEDPKLVDSNIVDVPSSPHWSSQASCILTHVTGNANPDRVIIAEGSENCFDDSDLDDGLIDLMVDESKSLPVTYPLTPAKRPLSPKLHWLSPKTYTPARLSQIPASLTDDPHLVPVNSNGDARPFMRPTFPKSIRDRSPILGLTNRTVLRICFRIGEALNAAAVASRTNVDAIIELYARVVFSSREASGGYKQFFQLGDLFTDKPPYLSGTYTLWKGVGIWDNDSKELVGEQGRGKMVRVMGRIKKKEPGQGQGPGVEMVVLSIWEVDWEDIGVAKGIACPKGS